VGLGRVPSPPRGTGTMFGQGTRRSLREALENVGGCSLDSCVRDAVVSVAVEAPVPLGGTGGKDPRAAGGLVDRRVGVVVSSVRPSQRRTREQGVSARDSIGQWVCGERAVDLVPDEPWHCVTVFEAGPRVDPVELLITR
jgi:hypothetical protein